MTKRIFNLIVKSLLNIENITGFTYNEVNIILYYFIIPFSWLCLLDIIFEFYYLKISFSIFSIGFAVGCRDFRNYSDWLFEKSRSFLKYFKKYGSNYIVSSIWICVLLPIMIYLILIYLILIQCENFILLQSVYSERPQTKS